MPLIDPKAILNTKFLPFKSENDLFNNAYSIESSDSAQSVHTDLLRVREVLWDLLLLFNDVWRNNSTYD